jgi:hypothetical protein
MHYQDILNLLDSVPFQPFRIHMTDGTTYDVPRRNLAWVTPTRVLLIVPSPESEHLVTDTHYLGLPNITRLEPLNHDAP